MAKLPAADTEITFCRLCRKYHGFETWCPFTLLKLGWKYLVLLVGGIAFGYGLLIEWSVKLLLLVLIAAFIYMALATVLQWEHLSPPLLRRGSIPQWTC